MDATEIIEVQYWFKTFQLNSPGFFEFFLQMVPLKTMRIPMLKLGWLPPHRMASRRNFYCVT